MIKTIEKYPIQISVGVAITVILFLIINAVAYTSWKSDIEHSIEDVDIRQAHLAEKYVKTNERITALENENTGFKIQMATIQTKLNNIEKILLEIKQSLK